jgi:MFS family permease
VAGALAARLGERNLAMTGGLLVALSSLMLSLVDRGWVDGIVFAALATSGAGLGLLVPAVTATVTTAVDDADLGIAGAATQTTNQIGTVIGMQALQTVQLAREAAGDLTASYESAFAVGAGVAVVGVLVASAMRRRVARAGPAVPG